MVQERLQRELRRPRDSHHAGVAPAGGPGDEGSEGGAQEGGQQGEGEDGTVRRADQRVITCRCDEYVASNVDEIGDILLFD